MIGYKFKHERPENEFHTFAINERDVSGTAVLWQLLRYALEMSFNMHKTSNKANPIYSFLIGSIDGVRLTELCWVPLGSNIMLQRRPMVRKLGHQQFVPKRCSFRLKDVVFTEDMDEEARMEALANAEIDDTIEVTKWRSNVHASTLPQTFEELATFKGTINKTSQWCRSCNEIGHLSDWCPKQTDDLFVPIYKRQRPTGIPLSDLRLAETNEEKTRAFLSRNNELLVLK